jgi:triosephosphate isomerase
VAAAEQVRIVYGGHVTETNVDNLIKLPDCDGFIFGIPSTKPTFRSIFTRI